MRQLVPTVPTLRAWRVVTPAHVEILRCIRNAGREGFAHDNELITPAAQAAWWSANHDRVSAWLFSTGTNWDATQVVGYGLIRRTPDGRLWSSVAVAPAHRGHHYGVAITRALVDLVIRESGEAEVWGEALVSNPAAIGLHDPEYWDVVQKGERTWTFRTKSQRG